MVGPGFVVFEGSGPGGGGGGWWVRARSPFWGFGSSRMGTLKGVLCYFFSSAQSVKKSWQTPRFVDRLGSAWLLGNCAAGHLCAFVWQGPPQGGHCLGLPESLVLCSVWPIAVLSRGDHSRMAPDGRAGPRWHSGHAVLQPGRWCAHPLRRHSAGQLPARLVLAAEVAAPGASWGSGRVREGGREGGCQVVCIHACMHLCI